MTYQNYYFQWQQSSKISYYQPRMIFSLKINYDLDSEKCFVSWLIYSRENHEWDTID